MRPTKIVEVDLKKEVLKLAEKAHIKPEELDLEVKMTNREYLSATVRAHYVGRDQGFAEAVRSVWPWWVTFGAGLAVYPVCTMIYKAALVAYYVWTFTPPTSPE